MYKKKGGEFMKKRLITISLVIVLLISLCASVYAVESRTQQVFPSLSFSGTTANCSVSVYGDNHSDEINHALFIDGYQVVSSGNLQGMLSVADPNYSYFRSIYFTNDQVYPYSLGTRSGYIDEFILVS